MTVLRRSGKKGGVDGVGDVHRRLFGIERDDGSTVDPDILDRFGLHVPEMVGRGHKIRQRRTGGLFSVGQLQRHVGERRAEAVFRNDAERGKIDRVAHLENGLRRVCNHRQSVDLDRIGDLCRIALAVGCAAPDRDRIPACDRSALQFGRDRKGNAETVDGGNAEQFVCDLVGRLHIVLFGIAGDNGSAVYLDVLDLRRDLVARDVDRGQNDRDEVPGCVFRLFDRERDRDRDAKRIGRRCSEQFRVQRVGEVDRIFFFIII